MALKGKYGDTRNFRPPLWPGFITFHRTRPLFLRGGGSVGGEMTRVERTLGRRAGVAVRLLLGPCRCFHAEPVRPCFHAERSLVPVRGRHMCPLAYLAGEAPILRTSHNPPQQVRVRPPDQSQIPDGQVPPGSSSSP